MVQESMIGAIGEIEIAVGVPRGFFLKLVSEDDWSFVIKLHALIEAALTHLLSVASHNAALNKVYALLDTSDTGGSELAEDLDIETVTEIFIRVNSAGAELSQADFAMSKIAANETYGGNMLRKAIDYFCHLTVAPDFLGRIEKGDKAFAASEFLPQMRWLKDVNDDIYDPTYTDMLRVAFTSEFGRGKLADLVALLSGGAPQAHGSEDQGVVRGTLMTADIRGWRFNKPFETDLRKRVSPARLAAQWRRWA